jgi:hypothetical protein
MTPSIEIEDFSGGLNTRDRGHLVAINEATALEGVDIKYRTLRVLGGYRRVLIDEVRYPERSGYPGSAGGAGNAQPILGRWRYYYESGYTHSAWVRVHGTTCEYWVDGSGQWVTIGAPWPNGAVPTAVQFENTIYILHGDPGTAYTCKYLFYNGTNWQSGDVPVPGVPLANLRPAFAVEYRDRIYAVDVVNEPFRLRFSGVGLPETWTAPEGGFVPFGEESGDPITGLHVHNDVLYVFRRSSVWRYWVDFYGTGHKERVHGAAGCIAHRTICSYYDAIYYASDEGMMCIYGADSDCVSHKIMSDVTPHPDYLIYMQAAVHTAQGALWVTYLEEPIWESGGGSDGDSGESGDETGGYWVWNTVTWRADIRRPNMLHPRWVRLPYLRITNFALPPGANNYRGDDYQRFHFDAQQPDMEEWNPNPAVAPDPAYVLANQGGPRHYSYRWDVGFDRDQIPAYTGYAGDNGVGYHVLYSCPRLKPRGNLRDLQWDKMRLDYFIWKNAPIHQGIDAAYMLMRLETVLQRPQNASALDPTHWPISTSTPDNEVSGGQGWQGYDLLGTGMYNKTIKFDINVMGTADRQQLSHAFELRYLGVDYKPGPDTMNVEE